MPIRILVSYVTAGTGHRRAAEAIRDALAERFPGADVRCLDVLTYSPGRFHAFYAWTYLLLVRHVPWVWQVSYGLLDLAWVYALVQPLRRRWNLAITRRFTALLQQQRPDAVVVTHFLPADVCSAGRAAGWLKAPLVVIVTDLHPHRFWISPEADAMVISTPEGAAVLARRGVAKERIRVIGIPVGKAFTQLADRAELGQRFGLQEARKTVLVTSGGTTVGRFEEVVASLAGLETELPGQLQLLVVCGEDEAARRRLTDFAARTPMPVRVFGFVDYMADLMAASDLIVAKAGGLTVSEALGRGIPLIFYHVIPGQERLNADYTARSGAAIIAPQPAEAAAAVRQCLQEPQRLEAMRSAARAIAHPWAADTIASEVVAPLIAQRVSS